MNGYARIEIDDTIIGNCSVSFPIPTKTRKIDMRLVEQAKADMMVMRSIMFVNQSPTIKGYTVFK